ncbi:MAG: hypothetical protein ACOVP1_03115 [Bacteroidia bacterium]
MKTILLNILAVAIGVILGSMLNMFIINISSSIIPPPEGADVTTIEGLKSSMHLFQPINYLMPFLAHALGSLVGAVLAGLIAASHRNRFSMAIGIFFLIGGILNIYMLPSPLWFSICDLSLAYLPMGFLGGRLAMMIRK